MNQFLEKHGYNSPAEKTAGSLMLLIICGGIAFIAMILMAFALAFPIIAGALVGTISGLYLYFRLSSAIASPAVSAKCPICHEKVETPDRWKMDCGNYCHDWCASMLERTEP